MRMMTSSSCLSSKAVRFTALALLACAWSSGIAKADFTLTPAAINAGFGLTTFATGFPTTNSSGPKGIEFTPGGGVLVADLPGNVRLFPTDTDNQNAASVPPAQNYGFDNASDLARIGNSFYMTQTGTGQVIQINANGTFNQSMVSTSIAIQGMRANPLNGHLWVAGGGSILDVDPLAKTFTMLVSGIAGTDGLSVSADGKTVYVAANISGHVLGFDTTTKALVFDSGVIPGTPDGTALGVGPLAGNIFANTNGGQLFEINLTTGVQTLFGTGGTRGDFVTVDPNNGSLLITQADRILRITGFAVPEPGSLVLTGIGLAGLLGYGWRRQRRMTEGGKRGHGGEKGDRGGKRGQGGKKGTGGKRGHN